MVYIATDYDWVPIEFANRVVANGHCSLAPTSLRHNRQTAQMQITQHPDTVWHPDEQKNIKLTVNLIAEGNQ